eukprot:TRINITY_DN91316_c0_g1_i1.p1 TRINITY_DN91316_c0_g1~~TRINITY_DN91316_c0_g1_i1.p1  ORF type:complete len:207 (-),score=27.08 TRINITY_DN91316_c0_g1_i1:51-671(-)
MSTSSPSIIPSIGQIVRRCMGLLRAIDLVNSFRCYTSLVLLVDVLRHGANYLKLPSLLEGLLWPGRRSIASGDSIIGTATAAAASGFVLTALSQVLLGRLTGGKRLTLSMVLWGGWGEVICPALLFAMVCLADLAAVVAPLGSAGSEATASQLTEQDAASGGRVHGGSGRSTSAELLVVSMQALLRSSLIVTFRLAQRKRTSRVLP